MINKIIKNNSGKIMFKWAKDLFPICRSLTGEGNRKTLRYIKNILPNLKIKYVKSGYKAFDWVVPLEWNIKDAYIKNSKGEKIVNFKDNNLHVMGYSIPIHKKVNLNDLQNHLFSIKSMPNAIPYKTSYYKSDWGFCIEHKKRKTLKNDFYEIKIDSNLKKGQLDYADLIIKGKSKKEIIISTYICHPSMANNELSGIIVSTMLAKWLSEKKLFYTYRFVFVPETLGAIVYIKKNLEVLKKRTIAGYVLSCVGDNNNYSYLTTPDENTMSDKVALHIMKHHIKNFKKYDFTFRGSDERQYCSPKVNLPIASIMRTKYGDYEEYHTSLDNLDFINSKGLNGSFEVMKKIINAIEANFIYKPNVYCEPKLSKYSLYPVSNSSLNNSEDRNLVNLIAFIDGKRSLLEIADKLNLSILDLSGYIDILLKHKLIKK